MQPNNKKGRPGHEEHRCNTCLKTYKTADSLYQHKRQAQSGKVKCAAPQPSLIDGFIQSQPLNIIATGLGPKSLMHSPTKHFTIQEKLALQGNEEKSWRDTSLPKKQETSTSADTIEVLEKRLRSTQEWEMVYDIVQSSDYDSIPNEINRDFALSLLHQTGELEEYPTSYLRAFTKAISALSIRKIPPHLMKVFVPFVKSFKPNSDQHKLADLIILFEFTKALGSCWDWLSLAEDKASIIIAVPAHCNQDISGDLAVAFAAEHELHSSSFFAAFDNMMRLPGYQRQMHPFIQDFFEFVKEGKARSVTCELMEDYRSFRSKYKDFDLRSLANCLRACTSQIIPDLDILQLVRLCFKYGEDIVKQLLYKREVGDDMGLFVSRVEDIINEKAKIEQEKQQFKQEQEKKRVIEQLKNKDIKNKQKKYKEEQKKKEEEENQLQQEKFATSLRQSFDLFAVQNQFQEEVFAQVLSFVDGLQKIAATINKQLRPEQLVALGLLLLSQKHTTLIQLATGAGKSLMFAILAQYINSYQGKKVIIAVPSAFLHAYQQYFYCPTASRVPEKITDPDAKNIFYCCYDRLKAPEFEIPPNTVLLVDEFHELFFNQQPRVINGKFISVILKLKAAAQLIGMSATFRGDTGRDKINTIMNAQFLTTYIEIQEREMQLEVYGEVTDITSKATQLALDKSKQMPTILFCSNPQHYKQLLPEAKIFAGEDIGVLLAILESLRTKQNGIVITTPKDSKGVDFLFEVPQSYVIHTILPQSIVQLKQDSGRGVRGSDLPIIGAIITEKSYTTLQQVELGLQFNEQFDKLYPADYLQSLQYLEQLPMPTTEPQIKALEEAVSALNGSKSLSAICSILSKSTAFKKILPKNMEFKIPVPLIGKGDTPQKSIAQIEQQPTTAKRQKTAGIASYFQQKPKSQQQKEEAKTSEECLREHGRDIVNVGDSNTYQCRMCQQEFSGLGFKCTICSVAYYCMDCRKLDADKKINDGTAASVNQLSLLDEIESQQEDDIQIQMQDEDTQINQDIVQQHSLKVESVSSSVILGLTGVSQKNKREKKTENKEYQTQEQLEKQAGQSERSKISIGSKASNRCTVHEVIQEEWKLIRGDIDKAKRTYYRCLKSPCNARVRVDNRKYHACK